MEATDMRRYQASAGPSLKRTVQFERYSGASLVGRGFATGMAIRTSPAAVSGILRVPDKPD